MHGELLVLALLLGAGLLLLLSSRTGVPYPIPLVAGGVLLAFLPGAEDVELPPEVVLLAFLPPLLYSAAFFSSLQDLRANARPIALLAIVLVVVTALGVAAVAHWVVGLPWEAAFVLGAIVSPTDPVAAVQIAQRTRAPRRLVTLVEGEALVNDASGLIVYSFAVAAAVSGSFSLADATFEFVYSSLAGIAIGLAVGWLIGQLRARLDDPPVEIAISLITPYFAYLPAEALHVSAVLAAVTSGLFLGWNSPQLITPQTRIQAFVFWELLVFAMNAVLFVLVGTQVHAALEALDERSIGELLGYGLAVSAAVTLIRMVFLFPWAWLARMLERWRGVREPPPDARFLGLLGWSGMRGAVSLAAALALPLETDSGAPFPERDLIVFCAFAVIFVTVVGQGMTLGPLIERARIFDDEQSVAEQEAEARLRAAQAALDRLEELREEDWVRDGTHERMRGLYEFRVRRFEAQLDEADDGDIERGSQAYQQLRRQVLQAERAEIIRLRNRGLITDDIMRRIERDLDLEDARLEID
ncbi:Na+/H+ antiporter [Conexibacter sp. SYSU D00693]|uniref:Na+/H+ antiporter n=1 Tax=Conexibacter sp. SYSU D00693 TaxID=2812560 RepID=UPI00196A37C9|nr:Na+/H+ antiporter [Conexibacter sp. SYSU D00693]